VTRRRARIAFFSPLPPAMSGIADYAIDVLAMIEDRFEIDVYCAQDRVDRTRLPKGCTLYPARHAADKHKKEPYDLGLFQLGNSVDHAFMYEHLPHMPALVVLHDLVLHHSRAQMLLDTREARAYAADPSSPALRDAVMKNIGLYREELAYSYPEQARRLGDVQLETVGKLLPYAYPLFRIPVETARLTVVHNAYCADAILNELPDAMTAIVPMCAEPLPATQEQVDGLRQRYKIAPDEFVVASFGLITREKGIGTVAQAAARARARLERLRLLFVGAVPDTVELYTALERVGMSDNAVVTHRVPFRELGAHMQLAELAIHLRYPTARETSAALLRLLAQGRPTVMSDVENMAMIPGDAVVRASPTDEEGDVTRAILRLAERPERRAALSHAATRYAREEHSFERCQSAYIDAIEHALALPDPPIRPWPAHWQHTA